MSEVLTVPTAFGDISDMAQGLVDRVDEQQIILYGPSAYEEGSSISFALLLIDGSTALEGRGVVAASVDGGDDRDPSTRFDIVLQALEFDGVAEVVFERMVMARQSVVGEEPADVSKSSPPPAFDDLAAEAPAEESPADPAVDDGGFGGFEDESTVVAGIEQVEALAASISAELRVPAEPEPEPEPEPEVEPELAAEPEPEVAAAAEPEPVEQAAAPVFASESPPAAEPEAPLAAQPYFAEEAATEPPPDESTRPSSPPRTFRDSTPPASIHPARSFAPAPRETDSLRPAAADLPIRPGAPAPEQPAPPPGFAIDNSLAGGLVRPHSVWSPVAPPPPEPRPSSGLFDYGPGPIPIPQRPPRPDLDPSLRVQRAPAPIREGEAPTRSEAPPARPSRPRRSDFDDALMADAVDLDPVSADD